jgi:hypothetical protein
MQAMGSAKSALFTVMTAQVKQSVTSAKKVKFSQSMTNVLMTVQLAQLLLTGNAPNARAILNVISAMPITLRTVFSVKET